MSGIVLMRFEQVHKPITLSLSLQFRRTNIHLEVKREMSAFQRDQSIHRKQNKKTEETQKGTNFCLHFSMIRRVREKKKARETKKW